MFILLTAKIIFLVAAAEWLNTSQTQVYRYIKSGKVWNNQYTFRNSS